MDPMQCVSLILITLGQLAYLEVLCDNTNCSLSLAMNCLYVDCSNRNLSSVPSNLPTSTCELNLHGNHISRLLNESLSNYPNLTLLNVSSNVISDIEESSFRGTGELRSLDMSNNFLSFINTTHSVLFPLERLEYLDLSNNSYSDYPDMIISSLKSLKSLHVDGFMKTLGKGFRNLEELRNLSLSKGKCHIDHLSKTIFENVANITRLNISYCRIYSVERGALSLLLNIDTLDLSGNFLLGMNGIENATQGLQNSKLKILLINHMVEKHTICIRVKQTHIMHLQNSSLEIIETNDNRIELLYEDVPRLLPNSLKYATVRNNRFTYGAYIWYLQNLTNLMYLDLSGTRGVRKLPFADNGGMDASYREETNFQHQKGCTSSAGHQYDHCYQDDFKNYDEEQTDYYNYNDKEQTIPAAQKPYGIPPNLKTFKFTDSTLAFELSQIHFAENRLRYIDLSYNIFTVWKGPMYGLENVTYLDLSCNEARYVYPDFFKKFYSLKFLNISHNFLGSSFHYSKHGIFFRNQYHLEVLDMTSDGIVYLDFNFFNGLKSLQVLNISKNLISNISLNLENNINLTHMDCSHNSIGWTDRLGRYYMSKLTERHNFSLDLSHNPLRCGCNSLDFFEWFLNSKLHPVNLENTHCMNDKDKVIHFRDHPHLLFELKYSCKSYIVVFMGTMAASVLVFSLMLSAICYRYRWRLTYWYFVVKLKLKSRRSDPQQYDYDMYVAYADSDLDFVCRNMIQMLETQRGDKLYIRDRDSLPGNLIAENIIDAIRRSKRTVLLLSKMFLKKKWCRYELHMANMESVSTGRSVMVIVMLEDIPNEDIPPEILYQVQNSRFIDYPQDVGQREHFWATLHASISM